MSSAQQKPPTAMYQHMCLHNALNVQIDRKDGHTRFLDVNHVSSNLFEKDSHSDRLLDHYLSRSHQKELSEAAEEGHKAPHCTCDDYANYLRTEHLHGEKAPIFSMRERLMKLVTR